MIGHFLYLFFRGIVDIILSTTYLLTQWILGLGMPSASHSKVTLSPSLTSTKLPPSVLMATTDGETHTSK